MTGAGERDRAKRRIVVGALATMALATLDQTIVAPALPAIGAELGHAGYVSWVVAAYLTTATAATPLYGKIADTRGRKPALYAALAIFILGATLSAAASSLPLLVAARAVQGVGGGGLIALAQTVIADVVAPKERGRYVAYISAVWLASSVAGPALGGVFVEHLHWKLIFLIHLPLGLVAGVICMRALADLPDARRPRALDLTGAALAIAATVALMLALTWAARRAEAWPEAPAAFLIGVALTALLAAHLRRAAEPLIPLGLFGVQVARWGAAAMFFGFGGYLGLSTIAPFHLSTVGGLSLSQAGLALMALLIGGVAGASSAGRMMGRVVHYKRLAITGMVVAALAAAALAARAASAGAGETMILLFAIGAGAGAQNPVVLVSVQNAVAAADLGMATALTSFVRSLGGAFGAAAMGGMLTHGASGPIEPGGFSAAFALAAFCFVAAGFCLLMMEQKPLRERSAFDEARDDRQA
jgi:MFS family permease